MPRGRRTVRDDTRSSRRRGMQQLHHSGKVVIPWVGYVFISSLSVTLAPRIAPSAEHAIAESPAFGFAPASRRSSAISCLPLYDAMKSNVCPLSATSRTSTCEFALAKPFCSFRSPEMLPPSYLPNFAAPAAPYPSCRLSILPHLLRASGYGEQALNSLTVSLISTPVASGEALASLTMPLQRPYAPESLAQMLRQDTFPGMSHRTCRSSAADFTDRISSRMMMSTSTEG